MNSHQYHEKALNPSTLGITEAGRRVLGLLIIVIVVLQLGRGNKWLGWRW